MTTRSTTTLSHRLCGILAAASMLAAAPSQAQVAQWANACNVTDAETRKAIEAVAAIVHPDQLEDNLDGTFRIETDALLTLFGTPLTLDSLFRGQTTYAPEGSYRTGFLVAPDIVLTAPHKASSFVGFKVVFGIHDATTSCMGFDPNSIPESNIFEVESDSRPVPGVDFALLKLDDAPSRDFIRLRRSSRPNAGEAATVIGHPGRLQTYLDLTGEIDYVTSQSAFFERLHFTDYSSGSPVFNQTRHFVESIVVGGTSCARADCVPHPTDPLLTCIERKLESNCPTSSFLVNGPTATTIAAHVPPRELLVSPLDTLKQASRTGPITEPVTTYTLTAPKHAGAAASIDYLIVPSAAAPVGEPDLVFALATPLSGTLNAGDTLSFDVTTTKPSSPVSCETHEREFLVVDQTHGFTDRVRQRVEIGYTGFIVNGSDKEPLRLEGIETPYRDEKLLRIHNPYLTAIAIHVEASHTWLTLDSEGPTGSSPAYLNIIVNPGQTRDIPVGLSSAAELLTADGATTHTASISLTALSTACTLIPTGSIGVHFTPGTLTVAQAINAQAADAVGATPGTPLTSSMTIEEDFCIDSVQISYGMQAADLTAEAARDWAAETVWRAASPGSLSTIPLWDRDITLIGSDHLPYRQCLSGAGGTEDCHVLVVGEPELTPPDSCPSPEGCQNLSELIGESGRGIWSTFIRDHVPGGVTPPPVVLEWRLKFIGHPGCAVP